MTEAELAADFYEHRDDLAGDVVPSQKPVRLAVKATLGGPPGSRATTWEFWDTPRSTNRYTRGVSATTIKVDSMVRDRLAALAQERGLTMGGLLAEVADQLERETFFTRARAQMEALRDGSPDEWAADRAESSAWQRGTDADAARTRDEPGWWE